MHAVDFEEVYKADLKKRILSNDTAETAEKRAEHTSLRKKENKQYKELVEGAAQFMKNHDIGGIETKTMYGKCVLDQDKCMVYRTKKERFFRYNGPVKSPNYLRMILTNEIEFKMGCSIEDELLMTHFNNDLKKSMEELIETLVNTDIKKYARSGYKN